MSRGVVINNAVQFAASDKFKREEIIKLNKTTKIADKNTLASQTREEEDGTSRAEE